MQIRTALFAAALATATLAGSLAAPAAADRRWTWPATTVDGSLVDVQILVDGHVAPLYATQGRDDRHYFQAYKGRSYSIALTNTTGRRIGVLLAVDGLNVVNGERSDLNASEPMYVLDPWEHTVINGWRSSLRDVRRFVFVDEDRSYAERTGQANGDMGWIRVLAFNERGERFDRRPGINERQQGGAPVPYGSREEGAAPEAAPRAQAVPAPTADGEANRTWGQTKQLYDGPSAKDAAPGTGWGRREWDPVRQVWFVPEWRATDQLVFRYEYADGLRALGIEPYERRFRVFERDRGELGFAQPPRW
ncbi:MAG: hypothetical protein HY076_03235 [Candidatus Eisenbacteria bacterium]|uniref:Uncharacterized protein n=1 Tax=Eiseniibacteriota bacterium TaxID=2212470 RepID=A0A9D6L9T5_UNCEI|nr:hypothetical protein [Candidatus Eisenbacteria bacterium]MBI3539268.1 hypothetical protein [Candidatus Eisenbacteria bacterium]